jgi:ribA/ribD-fused uncharacterized protein
MAFYFYDRWVDEQHRSKGEHENYTVCANTAVTKDTGFLYEGKQFNSSEQFFQWYKIKYYLKDKTNAEAKAEAYFNETKDKAGRDLQEMAKPYGDPDPNWHKDRGKMKREVMRKALFLKFTNNPQLIPKLLSTGDAVIIEDTGSFDPQKNDTEWGKGKDGNGHNYLGIELMALREYFREKGGYDPSSPKMESSKARYPSNPWTSKDKKIDLEETYEKIINGKEVDKNEAEREKEFRSIISKFEDLALKLPLPGRKTAAPATAAAPAADAPAATDPASSDGKALNREQKINEVMNKLPYDITDDIKQALRSLVEKTIDNITDINNLDLTKFVEFLEKNKIGTTDAAVQSSFIATTIMPNAAVGLEALAFMIPGAAIACAIVVSATGLIAFINYNLTTQDAEIIPINRNELTEEEKEKKQFDPALQAIETWSAAEKHKEGLKRAVLGGGQAIETLSEAKKQEAGLKREVLDGENRTLQEVEKGREVSTKYQKGSSLSRENSSLSIGSDLSKGSSPSVYSL